MVESDGTCGTVAGYGVPRRPAVNRSTLLDDQHWFWEMEIPACMLWEAPWPGVTVAEWQGNQCAGCGCLDDLYADHDHNTGLFRGHLCPSCNVLEGVGESRMWVRWRSGWNPAQILGVQRQHAPRSESHSATGSSQEYPHR